eukprot:Seg667.5 transcript_id=Seg667.5/GoldUCD/mRNA.D3Y31 product="Pancreatic lipase-related protein 2" protein_id=Seg667.5/GoldUCD/D3Y31
MIALKICALAFLVGLVRGDDQICYAPYGCFSNEAPFNRRLVQLPESPHVVGTKFMVYTRLQSKNPDIISDADPSSIKTSTFDGSKPTIFIAHGYLESGTEFYMRVLVDKLLKREDANVIVVHWQNGAKFPYHQAVGNIRLVGAQLSALIELMNNQFGLSFSRVHVIGSGLGAQLASYAGRNIVRINGTIARITGLDAAALHFQNEHIDVRLDPTDASFVDVIHTDSKTFAIAGYGLSEAVGHIDFYPNGGYMQRGCHTRDNGAKAFFTCSHYRAVHYFTESIDGKCPFRAYECDSWKDFTKARCTSCPPTGCPMMGYDAIEHKNKVIGSFYLRTSPQQPFCTYHYKVTFHTSDGYFDDLTAGAISFIISGENSVSEQIDLEDRYIASGSIEDFLAVTKFNLGKLLRIKVWHHGRLDFWKLHMVEVQQFGSSKKYVGCYNRWLNAQANEVPLQEYTGRYVC